MEPRDFAAELDQFEAHYRYDCTYMREMLEHLPDGYAKFADFMPLNSYRETLDAESYWVAKLAAMQAEDCGECLQLNVRMALEAGIAKQVVQSVLEEGNGLLDELRDLYEYSVCVAKGSMIEEGLQQRINARLDMGALLELGICIATARVFPTVKRASGFDKSCSKVELEV